MAMMPFSMPSCVCHCVCVHLESLFMCPVSAVVCVSYVLHVLSVCVLVSSMYCVCVVVCMVSCSCPMTVCCMFMSS